MTRFVLLSFSALAAIGCTHDWQRAQSAASRTMQCPVEKVYVEEGDDTGKTCLARDRPTCKELAQVRYDSCVAGARREGQDGRHAWGSNVAIVSASVTSSIAQNRTLDACQKNDETENAGCSSSTPPSK